jgi:integrase
MIRRHKARNGKVTYYAYVSQPGTDIKKYVGKANTKEGARQLERTGATTAWRVKHGLSDPDPKHLFRDLAMPWVEARGSPGSNGQPRRAAWRDDLSRMRKHILPFFGTKPIIDCGSVQLVREFIRNREPVIGGTTLGNVLRLLSRFFNELPDNMRRRIGNPVAQLDTADRPRRSHDPRTTPFLENKADIRQLISDLPTPIREIYAVCVLAGLRPGEARSLFPGDINLRRRTIHVQRTAKDKAMPGGPKIGPLKDHEARVVPIGEELLTVLKVYMRKREHRRPFSPFLFPAVRHRDGASGMVDAHTVQETYRDVRDQLALPGVNFYQASRHSYASHYVIDGGSIERLSKILGHSSVVVTERYAHFRADHFTEHDLRPMLRERPQLRVLDGGRAKER